VRESAPSPEDAAVDEVSEADAAIVDEMSDMIETTLSLEVGRVCLSRGVKEGAPEDSVEEEEEGKEDSSVGEGFRRCSGMWQQAPNKKRSTHAPITVPDAS
jgi:hypothetical protein